jgi:hypothetical protein
MNIAKKLSKLSLLDRGLQNRIISVQNAKGLAAPWAARPEKA